MKLLLTTSRKTSQRVRQFIKEFSYIFPKSFIQRSNRGKMSLNELFEQSLNRYDRIILITNRHGNPNKILGYYKKESTFQWCFEFKLQNVKLSYELQTSLYPNPEKIQILYENIDENLEKVLRNFFEPFVIPEENTNQNDFQIIVLKHKERGFQIYVENGEDELIPPEITIDEIIIEDPEMTGEE